MTADRDRDADELEAATEDLHAVGSDLVADARRVAAIEEIKSRLEPADPRLLELARESRRLTERMAVKASGEMALAARVHEAARPDPNRDA